MGANSHAIFFSGSSNVILLAGANTQLRFYCLSLFPEDLPNGFVIKNRFERCFFLVIFDTDFIVFSLIFA